ncbi:MAG: 4-hydroxythreonine-4-phosphate dehydrogenase PdxA [Synergistaceae bacterium]|nr:4-hydroxythreonine-4-phosphate dehydrogenase PdxA [Synergistaceae bacterium]
MAKPIITIPIGDPAGVGPEIVVKALVSDTVKNTADCIVIGDKKIIDKAIALTGVKLKVHLCKDSKTTDFSDGVINLIDLDNIDMSSFSYGKVQAMCGQAAYDYIECSIKLAMSGEADAVATTPINKEALHAANVPFIGHTEIFGALTNTKDPLTMFETNGLRVFFLTRHLSLLQMLGQIRKNKIVECAKECLAALERLGVTGGTMAVAGLNPHCGEHGLFGWEEVNEITPAVEQLKAEGYNVAGPIGADSVFHQAAQGRYSSVLSLYHDQGHIATKTLDFERTISITNGMPILRTSVDHGTAFDIAGKNIVSEVSMIEAIRLAAKYAPFFKKGQKNS